jgi:hypothetical protein
MRAGERERALLRYPRPLAQNVRWQECASVLGEADEKKHHVLKLIPKWPLVFRHRRSIRR